jgi:uncharacterized protein YndB with AHSA1/START domain
MEISMSQHETTHDTFVITKSFAKSCSAVFNAFADVEKKQRWYAQSDAHDQLSYTLDFKPDGREELIGKMRDGTPIAGATLRWSSIFHDIVEDERIVFSQTLDLNNKRISCALITVAFGGATDNCEITLTHQAVFLEGADGPDMRRMGWEVLLDRTKTLVESE